MSKSLYPGDQTKITQTVCMARLKFPEEQERLDRGVHGGSGGAGGGGGRSLPTKETQRGLSEGRRWVSKQVGV